MNSCAPGYRSLTSFVPSFVPSVRPEFCSCTRGSFYKILISIFIVANSIADFNLSIPRLSDGATQLPSLLLLIAPSPLLTFRSLMKSLSPSTSELFFRSCFLADAEGTVFFHGAEVNDTRDGLSVINGFKEEGLTGCDGGAIAISDVVVATSPLKFNVGLKVQVLSLLLTISPWPSVTLRLMAPRESPSGSDAPASRSLCRMWCRRCLLIRHQAERSALG